MPLCRFIRIIELISYSLLIQFLFGNSCTCKSWTIFKHILWAVCTWCDRFGWFTPCSNTYTWKQKHFRVTEQNMQSCCISLCLHHVEKWIPEEWPTSRLLDCGCNRKTEETNMIWHQHSVSRNERQMQTGDRGTRWIKNTKTHLLTSAGHINILRTNKSTAVSIIIWKNNKHLIIPKNKLILLTRLTLTRCTN